MKKHRSLPELKPNPSSAETMREKNEINHTLNLKNYRFPKLSQMSVEQKLIATMPHITLITNMPQHDLSTILREKITKEVSR